MEHERSNRMKVGFAGFILLAACHHGSGQSRAEETRRTSALAPPVFVNPYANAAVDCRSASTLLSRRSGDGTPDMAPPLSRIRSCPTQAGVLLAALIDSSRQVRDTDELQRRTWLTQYVHDARILAAATSVARDADAAVEARLAAIRTMIWSKTPGQLLTLSMMQTNPGCDPARCYSTYEGHFYGPSPARGPQPDTTSWPVMGTAMRSGYAAATDSVFTALIANDTSASVRNAAAIGVRFPPAQQLRGR